MTRRQRDRCADAGSAAARPHLAVGESRAPQTDAASPNPYVFIVGCPRSGTTLTERLLDAHPQIAVTHETGWIPDCFVLRQGVSEAALVEPELVTTLLAHKRFGYLGVSREELARLVLTDPPLPYATFVSRLFDIYGRAHGKRLVGDRTPRYARWIAVLHHLWPRARFIHVIRDGRDVYLSTRSWISEAMLGRYPTWREHPALSAGLWWTRNVRRAREPPRRSAPACITSSGTRRSWPIPRGVRRAMRLPRSAVRPGDAASTSAARGRAPREAGPSAGVAGSR